MALRADDERVNLPLSGELAFDQDRRRGEGEYKKSPLSCRIKPTKNDISKKDCRIFYFIR
jgi:hypothetical protein